MSRKLRMLGLMMDACLISFLVSVGLAAWNFTSGGWVYAVINAVIACIDVVLYRFYAYLIQQQIEFERDYAHFVKTWNSRHEEAAKIEY